MALSHVMVVHAHKVCGSKSSIRPHHLQFTELGATPITPSLLHWTHVNSSHTISLLSEAPSASVSIYSRRAPPFPNRSEPTHASERAVAPARGLRMHTLIRATRRVRSRAHHPQGHTHRHHRVRHGEDSAAHGVSVRLSPAARGMRSRQDSPVAGPLIDHRDACYCATVAAIACCTVLSDTTVRDAAGSFIAPFLGNLSNF